MHPPQHGTGEHAAEYHQLKINLAVVHVGHFQRWLH